MDENTQVPNGDTQEAQGKTEGMTEAEFEQARQDGIAYETHRKALAQRARLKEEREQLSKELESYKQREMESQGKYQELVEAQRKRISELEEKTKQMSTSYQWNVIGAQIKSEFASRGVKAPDKALKYAVAAHKDDLNTIEVDDQYNVNSSDLKRFVDKFLTDNQEMGFVSKVGVRDLPPGKVELDNSSKQSIAKMSKDELMEYWKSAQE